MIESIESKRVKAVKRIKTADRALETAYKALLRARNGFVKYSDEYEHADAALGRVESALGHVSYINE